MKACSKEQVFVEKINGRNNDPFCWVPEYPVFISINTFYSL